MTRSNLNSFPELMSVEETAEYLAKGKNFVYSLIKSGEIPSIRLGKSIRVLREGLKSWLAVNVNNNADYNNAR